MNLCFGLLAIILIIGSLINYFFTRTLKEDAYQYNVELLEQTRQVVEVVLQETEKTAFSLALNRNVQKLAVLPWHIEDIYSVVKNVTDLFNEKISSTSYIHSIYLYSKKSGKIITNLGVLDLKHFWDRAVIDDFLNEKSPTKRLNTRRISSNTQSNVDVITFVMQIPFNAQSASGVLVININEKQLYDTVVNINNQKLGQAIIVDDEGMVISSREKTMLHERLDYYYNIQGITEKDKGYFILNKDDQEKFIAYISSNQNNWKYIAVTPYEQVFSRSTFIWRITLSICLICLIAGVILALFVSKRYYNPIKELVNVFSKYFLSNNGDKPKQEIGVFKDEFSYIKGSIESLIEQNEEFYQRFVDNEKLLKEHFLLNLILGGDMEAREIHSKIIYYGINLEMTNFQVMVLQIYEDGELGNLWEKQRNLLRYKIRILCEEIIAKHVKGVVIDHGSQRFIILLNFGEGMDLKNVLQHTKKISLQIRDALVKQMKVEASIGIGRIYSSITDIPLSYTEALEAVKYERIAGRNSIIFIDDVWIDQGNRKDVVQFQSLKMEMINELKLGNCEKACYFLNQCLDWIFENRRLSFQHKNAMLMELINSIIGIVMDINGDLDDIFDPGYNLYNELARLNSISVIKEWFNEVVINIAEYINNKQKRKNQEIVERVKCYVLSNYSDPITLDSIADTLYISRNHFCRLFKEITGETFGEYITRVRLEKACELLEKTQDTINDIAETVGFGNKQNIIRAFKKYYGMTPTQYRNQRILKLLQQ